jgi:hypothetical protein
VNSCGDDADLHGGDDVEASNLVVEESVLSSASFLPCSMSLAHASLWSELWGWRR